MKKFKKFGNLIFNILFLECSNAGNESLFSQIKGIESTYRQSLKP